MARKKSSDGDVIKSKAKTLFDHIKQIRETQDLNYFNTLSDEDKKSWSNYMICRFLSMQSELIDVINDLQSYQDKLSPEQFYRLCISVVPKSKKFYPYVKSKNSKHSKELLMILSGYFQESQKNIMDYLDLLSDDEICKIISMHGYFGKEIEDLIGKD